MCRWWSSVCLLLVTFASQTEGISVCPTREIQAMQGQVTSPNHPSNYPSNSDCTLTIEGGQNVRFKIKFDSFDLEDDEGNPTECTFDAFTIIDGSKSTHYCGSRNPPEYTSTGNKISIAFKSDSSYEVTGFNISFSTIEGPKAPNGSNICPSRETKVDWSDPSDKMEGALYSPNFPNFYPADNQTCTFTLDIPDNYKTVVWFESFSLQYHERCVYDKLVVSDEFGGETLCGGIEGRVPPPVELRGRKVQFAFSSNEDISARGFYLKYNITRIQRGRCVCTQGLSYIRINNYEPRNNRSQDDVRFEFKTTQSSGMIMYLKGALRDFIYVAYKDSRVFIFHIDLGTGQAKHEEPSSIRLNDNQWHKVHISRFDRTFTVNIDDGVVNVVGRTPGGYNRLDIPTPRAYFLGAPTDLNLLPNFSGCIRDFSVDGYEPITNAWVSKPDYAVLQKRAMRQCSSSDEL